MVMFPDRLIAVGVLLAVERLFAAEHAVLEFAEFTQLFHRLARFGAGEIAAPGRAAELQHCRGRDHAWLLRLRAVEHTFREIADRARRHSAIAVEVGFAVELDADLFKVVPVAGRIEVALRHANPDLEIIDRSGVALKKPARMKHAAAIFKTAHQRNFVALNHLHGCFLQIWQNFLAGD